MFSRPSRQAALLVLICAALLWARIGGAHLHLCFDGSEAPASLHLNDASHHADDHGDHHGAGESHSDIDMPLGEQPLTKPGKPVQDLTLLLFAAFCLAFLSFARERLASPIRLVAFASAVLRLLPPLRGPPRAHQGILRALA